MKYQLYYWRSIQGRGEFVRLALEEGGADYADVARETGKGRGVPALMTFLGYFEQILMHNPRGQRFLAGSKLTYADLSLFQIMAGLQYAFPRAMANSARLYKRLTALSQLVQERPRIARYLASERRIPFNDEGIFRHYPELDGN